MESPQAPPPIEWLNLQAMNTSYRATRGIRLVLSCSPYVRPLRILVMGALDNEDEPLVPSPFPGFDSFIDQGLCSCHCSDPEAYQRIATPPRCWCRLPPTPRRTRPQHKKSRSMDFLWCHSFRSWKQERGIRRCSVSRRYSRFQHHHSWPRYCKLSCRQQPCGWRRPR